MGEQYGLLGEQGHGGGTILIDKKGNVAGFFSYWSKDEVAKLEKLLAEK